MSTIVDLPWEPHLWLRQIRLAYAPGIVTPLLEQTAHQLLDQFRQAGHTVQPQPTLESDVILTTAPFGTPIRWRDALLFTARRRYKLEHAPTIFTLIHATPAQFRQMLDHFEVALKKEPVDPQDFIFPGLTSEAYRTLVEQGRRGGTILSLIRLIQSQAMSIRIILIVGEENPLEAYSFDLVGAHPRTDATDAQAFYQDLMYRIVTAVSTHEITDHQWIEPSLTQSEWQNLPTPPEMRSAGRELGARGFFTEMVIISNLVSVPSLHDVISSQYSEGCFASWDPKLEALIATITGSARPVDKGNLTDDELAVILGVRADGKGALIRRVEGKRNDPPSSEAVELIEMDGALPKIGARIDGLRYTVPAARSKLHGHRGVKAYHPDFVEHVHLDTPYYHYPVSCSTEAQARAIYAAFSRSKALQNPADPRQVVFTIIPGHGIVIVEKWVEGKAAFQVMWEYMDAGWLQIENVVPQGALTFVPAPDGKMTLVVEATLDNK